MAKLAYREVDAMNAAEARKRLVRSYLECGSIRTTARLGHTARQVVRKWVTLYRAEGEAGWEDRSRRPHTALRQTAPEQEQAVLPAREATQRGRRLALYLPARGITLSPHTIRHILRRHGYRAQRVRRQRVYPAQWAWEVVEPFTLILVDVKNIHGQGSLGTRHTTHLHRHHLPRDQWTAWDGRTRLRFLAFSHTRNSTHGLAFLILVVAGLRLWGVETPVTLPRDGGQGVWWGQSAAGRGTAPTLPSALGRGVAALSRGAQGLQRPGGAQPPHRGRGVLPPLSPPGARCTPIPEPRRALGVRVQRVPSA
ncbi:MAG: leucine zipper domain-containing protein [Anaerolineae bacterium]|nr:leucine zipper domain-containing protein [Anaerolineae bacterium]